VTVRPGQIITMLNRHLGPGLRIHRCLGVHLASVVTKVLIDTMLDRIPDYELDRAAPPVWHCGQNSGFESVTIVFPPANRSTDFT
jgi:cytochrome P450